jgi:hypothetical protein
MAADLIIQGRIDITKIIQHWMFRSADTGRIYLDFTAFYTKEKDEYQNNGMIVQKLPQPLYEREKNLPKEQKTISPILGNIRVWDDTPSVDRRELSPGYTGQPAQQKQTTPFGQPPATQTPFGQPAAQQQYQQPAQQPYQQQQQQPVQQQQQGYYQPPAQQQQQQAPVQADPNAFPFGANQPADPVTNLFGPQTTPFTQQQPSQGKKPF